MSFAKNPDTFQAVFTKFYKNNLKRFLIGAYWYYPNFSDKLLYTGMF